MPLVYKQLAAKLDITDHFGYLALHADLAVAERFLINIDASFTLLALNPLMGSPVILRNPELAGLRKWRVKDFDDALIFYMPRSDGVSILRVLHAAQDWWRLLGLIQQGYVGIGTTSPGVLLQVIVKAAQDLKHLFDSDHDLLLQMKADNDKLRAEFEAYKQAHP